MKKIAFTLAIALACPSMAYAQLKHDYIWTIGYGHIAPSPSGYPFGGIIMDFNTVPPTFKLQDYICDRPRATISDKSGKLVAYTEGCRVINHNHQIMYAGDTLSPGAVFTEFCSNNGDYPSWQPTIFLPKPGSDSLYYLFHIRGDNYWWNPMNLMYSVIDASGDNGNGSVIAKNKVLLSDSLYLGDYVTATRHGNGRDWWIVSPRVNSNNIHISLLNPEGVEYKGMQDIDSQNLPTDSVNWSSQTAFSQDGSKYFRNSLKSLLILDFDRCTGKMSNPVRLSWGAVPFGGGGVATSPNSRFLYLSSGGTVQQYDLWASNLVASMQVVAVYDGTLAPFAANFLQMMPGPDGKIYIITSHDNNVMHVIQNPDSLGMACHVEQHAITLPALSSYVMPTFANYKLGALDPPCASGVGTVNASSSKEVSLWPNPAKDILHLNVSASIESVAIFDATGKAASRFTQTSLDGQMTVDIQHLPPGLYYLSLRIEGKVWGGKFVKL